MARCCKSNLLRSGIRKIPTVLSIAGSDPSGGAWAFPDIKTMMLAEAVTGPLRCKNTWVYPMLCQCRPNSYIDVDLRGYIRYKPKLQRLA